MKKTALLLCAAISGTMLASAQIAETPVFENEYPCSLMVIPSYLTADKAPQILFNDYKGHFYIYNDNFDLVKTVNCPAQSYKVTYADYSAVPNLEIENTYKDGPFENGSKFDVASALSYISSTFGDRVEATETHGSETWFVLEYYRPWEYGNYIPYRYYLLDSNKQLYQVRLDYSGKILNYTDTWIKTEERESTGEYYCADLYYINPETGLDEEIDITQTFFNNDANYEFMVPVLTKKTVENKYDEINGTYGRKVVSTGDMITGYKLMNDKGETLQTLNNLPTYNWVDLYTIGSNNYVSFGDKYFKVNKSTTKLAEVTVPGLSVSPRAVRRSTPVEVTLGQGNAERTVSVISTSGSTVYTTKVGSGTNKTSIDTSRFPSGVYVVVVNDGNGNVENCKIAVR